MPAAAANPSLAAEKIRSSRRVPRVFFGWAEGNAFEGVRDSPHTAPERTSSYLRLRQRPLPMELYTSFRLGPLLLCIGATLVLCKPSPAQGTLGGQVVAWGSNHYGQISNAPTGEDFSMVESGEQHSIALRLDGSLASWGADMRGQVSQTPSTGTFIQVAAGAAHSLALDGNGSISSWGGDTYGQVSNSPAGIAHELRPPRSKVKPERNCSTTTNTRFAILNNSPRNTGPN